MLPGVVKVDARGGFTQAAEAAALPSLVHKARAQGVAVMGVSNSRGMSGALWLCLATPNPPVSSAAIPTLPCRLIFGAPDHRDRYIAEELAGQGIISIVMCNSPGYVARGVGSARRVFGTNPMAFGWPRPIGRPPLVWDQASSVMCVRFLRFPGVAPAGAPAHSCLRSLLGLTRAFGWWRRARGEIQVAQRDGHAIPEGVGVACDGAATTDPAEILAGAQLPFGQYKGANIAMMVELLSAALFGTDLAVDADGVDGKPFDTVSRGVFVLAIDAARMDEADAADRGEALFAAMTEGCDARQCTPHAAIRVVTASLMLLAGAPPSVWQSIR